MSRTYDLSFELLGDPHLGRRFINGVSLARRGDRERLMWADFKASLERGASRRFHICTGDLFDKSVVPFWVILDTAMAYRQAAAQAPHTHFVILMGNHDGSRDADFRSAFDVFTALVAGVPNIVVVRDKAVTIDNLGFCPWHPFRTSAEIIADLPEGLAAVFGHWDVDSFGGAPHNLLPFEWFAARPDTACYTGHVHKAEVRQVNGVEVNIVGSMQPYAHGEEAEPAMYLTVTMTELQTMIDGGTDLRNLCIRVMVKPGEELPEIDCLQLTHVQVTEDGEADDLNVQFDSFDMDRLFSESFAANEVPDDISAKIRERYQESRLQEAG